MATMSSYELKITGLIKADADPVKAAAASAAFLTMCQDPGTASKGSWSPTFFPPVDITYGADTPVVEGDWELLTGSLLKAGSQLAKDSTLNGLPICQDFTLPADTPITATTVLKEGSVIAQGSVARTTAYTTLLWQPSSEPTPAWALGPKPGDVVKKGNYVLLSLQAVIGVVRAGPMGIQWARGLAPDDLEWFYKYKETDWYKRLIYELIMFNDYWGNYTGVLEEEARIRDLKWYCGNGSGP